MTGHRRGCRSCRTTRASVTDEARPAIGAPATRTFTDRFLSRMASSSKPRARKRVPRARSQAVRGRGGIDTFVKAAERGLKAPAENEQAVHEAEVRQLPGTIAELVRELDAGNELAALSRRSVCGTTGSPAGTRRSSSSPPGSALSKMPTLSARARGRRRRLHRGAHAANDNPAWNLVAFGLPSRRLFPATDPVSAFIDHQRAGGVALAAPAAFSRWRLRSHPGGLSPSVLTRRRRRPSSATAPFPKVVTPPGRRPSRTDRHVRSGHGRWGSGSIASPPSCSPPCSIAGSILGQS
jgi:hypothetical protein